MPNKAARHATRPVSARRSSQAPLRTSTPFSTHISAQISVENARRINLEAQALVDPQPFGRGKAATLRAIEHLGYVQIDTISVVQRAHHHVLWSRVPDYKPAFLHELQSKDKSVFEYWSHAASYLPMRDYRYTLPRKRAIARGERHWFKRKPKIMAYVVDRIQAEGPLQARDFEAPPGARSANWFDWKPANAALNQLFMDGTLMIQERKGFQKVYELTERFLPSDIDTSFPRDEELARHLIRQSLRSHGLALEAEIRYLRKSIAAPLKKALAEMVDSGEITRVSVEDSKAEAFAFTATLEKRLPEILPLARILSPFDSLVIQRKRLSRFFGFDYLIECYVPEPKRKHGYFCLPLLWGDQLIARIDAKADRTEKTLKILRMTFEPGFKGRSKLKPHLREEIERFAAFNLCDQFEFTSTTGSLSADL